MEAIGASALLVKLRDTRLDKTGTNRAAKNNNSPQTPCFSGTYELWLFESGGHGTRTRNS